MRTVTRFSLVSRTAWSVSRWPEPVAPGPGCPAGTAVAHGRDERTLAFDRSHGLAVVPGVTREIATDEERPRLQPHAASLSSPTT
jgi:hypothetical protein